MINPFYTAPIEKRFYNNWKNVVVSREWRAILAENANDANDADYDPDPPIPTGSNVVEDSEAMADEQTSFCATHSLDIIPLGINKTSNFQLPVFLQAGYRTNVGTSTLQDRLSVLMVSPSGWYPSSSVGRVWCRHNESKNQLDFKVPVNKTMLNVTALRKGCVDFSNDKTAHAAMSAQLKNYYSSHPAMIAYRQSMASVNDFNLTAPLSRPCQQIIPLAGFNSNTLASAQVRTISF